jgi:hypothetical protein
MRIPLGEPRGQTLILHINPLHLLPPGKITANRYVWILLFVLPIFVREYPPHQHIVLVGEATVVLEPGQTLYVLFELFPGLHIFRR